MKTAATFDEGLGSQETGAWRGAIRCGRGVRLAEIAADDESAQPRPGNAFCGRDAEPGDHLPCRPSNQSPGKAGGFIVAGPSKGPYRDERKSGATCSGHLGFAALTLSGPAIVDFGARGHIGEEPTAENIKQWLPSRQSRGASLRARRWRGPRHCRRGYTGKARK